MKLYKGFNKDMTCRGFQYKEGETYTTDRAELCESGFHACENPLDTFGYYPPGTSVYHEVELDGVAKTKSDDSKRCGTSIKIGAELNVMDLCKLHFDYVKNKTEKTEEGENWSSLAARDCSSLAAGNCSSLAARDWSSLAAQDRSSLAAQDRSSLAARDCSSLAARDCSSLAAQDRSSLAAQNRSSLAAGNRSSLAAGNCSSLAAQDRSSLAARDCSSLAAGNCSSLAARDCSSLAAQDRSSLAAGNCSSLAAQDRSSLAAGKNSVIAAFNSKAKGDIGTLIALANRNGEYKITDFKAAIVDGETIKANTWYTLLNGEFKEVTDDEE